MTLLAMLSELQQAEGDAENDSQDTDDLNYIGKVSKSHEISLSVSSYFEFPLTNAWPINRRFASEAVFLNLAKAPSLGQWLAERIVFVR